MSTKWKLLIIGLLVVFCAIELYPPEKKLKPGIDLAGGASLTYQIDTTGLDDVSRRNVAQEMIRIQRQRVDPSGQKNLVWRVQGRDRIEIQMPLASKETQVLRDQYQAKLDQLAEQNMDMRMVQRALLRPADMSLEEYRNKRDEAFARLAGESAERQEVLDELKSADDAYMEAQEQVYAYRGELTELEQQLEAAEVADYRLQGLYRSWEDLDDPNRVARVQEIAGEDEAVQQALQSYVATRKSLAEVRNTVLDPREGLRVNREDALREVNSANIDTDRLNRFLGSANAAKRAEEINSLKERYPKQAALIDEVIKAYESYNAVAGRLDDPEDLKRMLRGSGVLEFRIIPVRGEDQLSDTEIQRYLDLLATVGPNPARPGYEDYSWRKIRSPEDFKVTTAILGEFAGDVYVLASNKPEETLLHEKGENTWRLKSARVGNDQIGNWAVNFEMNEIGASRFHELTKNNLQRHLCILLDDEAVSAPVLRSAIFRRGQITGEFSAQEIQDLVDKLNAGSLPARLNDKPDSENTIGPTMGRDNLEAGLRAGVVGLIVVAVFMIVYYLVGGALADLALALNMLLILAAMAFSDATFTMPGIAGLILTIGMAVDANVLIFERIREEQNRGSNLATAVKNGYARVFRTIFDANLTTFITALILWVLASEEVKGFALTLMLGIVSSMFTALFVTRTVFDFMLKQGWLKEQGKLKMFEIVKRPNINWMGKRRLFQFVSVVLVIGSWAVFFGRSGENSKLSIEFTGGTSVHVVLNEDSGQSMTRADIEAAVQAAGEEMGNAEIAAARVQQIGPAEDNKYEIVTTETNRVQVTLGVPENASINAGKLQELVRAAADKLGDSRSLEATVVAGSAAGQFVMETDQVNRGKIRELIEKIDEPKLTVVSMETRELVSDAVRQALLGKLDVQDNLYPTNMRVEDIGDELVATQPELLEYIGGVKISFDFGQGKSDTLARLNERFDQTRFKEDYAELGSYDFALFAPDMANVDVDQPINGVTVAVAPDDILDGEEFKNFKENQIERFSRSLEEQTSLPRVTQIDPTVGSKSLNEACIAIVVSLLAIIAYIWLRFGDWHFGAAAVIALFHDVSIAMGLVAASAWLTKTPLSLLLIGDFKIDLPMIAGFLTVIGYSLNDTIVVFDRIRENRGKLAKLSPELINNSINQTISRTILTSFTTLLVLLVMYIWGGEGLRGFNYVLIIGIVVGTYSSIGIAAPWVCGTMAGQSGPIKNKES